MKIIKHEYKEDDVTKAIRYEIRSDNGSTWMLTLTSEEMLELYEVLKERFK